MTDADTIANAEQLWELVHLVQDTIDKDGSLMLVGKSGSCANPLAAIRALADQLDPENGKY